MVLTQTKTSPSTKHNANRRPPRGPDEEIFIDGTKQRIAVWYRKNRQGDVETLDYRVSRQPDHFRKTGTSEDVLDYVEVQRTLAAVYRELPGENEITRQAMALIEAKSQELIEELADLQQGLEKANGAVTERKPTTPLARAQGE